MKKSAWEVADLVMKQYPDVLVFVSPEGGYNVYPKSSVLSDVSPSWYEKAVYLRRALPGLVQTWKLELVRRSQPELTL